MITLTRKAQDSEWIFVKFRQEVRLLYTRMREYFGFRVPKSVVPGSFLPRNALQSAIML